MQFFLFVFFFFQAEDGIRDVERSRGLGDVYKRQVSTQSTWEFCKMAVSFIIVVLVIFFLLYIYVILPFDLIPESLVGVCGIIDDILLIIGVLFGLTRYFYRVYSESFQEQPLFLSLIHI
eukprot:TRINITY_DN32783_c0_g1_i2.p2 TRINITY_DN32783_c0_g1~~TRINITY_DN32783_c0_g1_i2.p2  ORF type:complete len:120 (+),score=30.58 TRINITY_DN32783_c0_g1_i2:82-441(+)